MSSKLETVRSTKGKGSRQAHAALASSYIFTKYIGKLKVGQAEESCMSLGVFGADRPAKGFSIGLSPDPKPAESIATEIIAVGSNTRHELFLSVVNLGKRPVTLEVWRI